MLLSVDTTGPHFKDDLIELCRWRSRQIDARVEFKHALTEFQEAYNLPRGVAQALVDEAMKTRAKASAE